MAENTDNPEWWTPAELAKRWRKSDDTICRLCKSGKLLHMKIGGAYSIHRDEIARHERAGIPNATQHTVTKPRRVATPLLNAGRRLVGGSNA